MPLTCWSTHTRCYQGHTLQTGNVTDHAALQVLSGKLAAEKEVKFANETAFTTFLCNENIGLIPI